jgi:hypothetical protein
MRHEKMRIILLAVTFATAVVLQGCESVAITSLGVGANVGASHKMNAVAYRTFTAPAARVKSATLTALNRMNIRVETTQKEQTGEVINARTSSRNIEVSLESLTPNTTRMRTVARDGLFYDASTAQEIVAQTERAMGKI